MQLTERRDDELPDQGPVLLGRAMLELSAGRACSAETFLRREAISKSYVSRILRLALLAPDIVERILAGRPTAGLAQFLQPFPLEWETQREQLC